MRKRFLKNLILVLLMITAVPTAAGCSNASEDTDACYLYLIEKEDTWFLEKTQIEVSDDASGDATASLMEAVTAADHDLLLPEEVEILNWSVSEGVLTIDFSAEYVHMEDYIETAEEADAAVNADAYEVLCRAAIVETMLQSEEVEAVIFTIEGEPLTNDDGIEIGAMTEDTFITNPAGQINSTQKTTVTLYFTDSTGTSLYPEQRTLHYFTSISVEWLVVENLIQGPEDESLSATVPSETTIISVTSADGICYVNLDQAFQSTDFTVTGEITIYSLVNSLCALDGIDSVQITVDGVSDIDYMDMESLNLNQTFASNADLIAENAEPIETEVEEESE